MKSGVASRHKANDRAVSSGATARANSGLLRLLKTRNSADKPGRGTSSRTTATVDNRAVVSQLPPFPAIAARLMTLLNQADVSFQEIAHLLAADVGFSSELLRIANSALMGNRYGVSSVQQAIALLGTRRVYAFVLTLGLERFSTEVSKSVAFRRCWRHSLACGLFCEELSPVYGLNKPDSYTAGLLHDIGRLALLVAHSRDYEQMIAVLDQQGGDAIKLEREYFGASHCQVGAWLVEEWNFPKHFQVIAARHHEDSPRKDKSLRGLVHVSCLLADLYGFGIIRRGCEYDIGEVESKLPAGATLPHDQVALARSIEEKINAFEFGHGDVR